MGRRGNAAHLDGTELHYMGRDESYELGTFREEFCSHHSHRLWRYFAQTHTRIVESIIPWWCLSCVLGM